MSINDMKKAVELLKNEWNLGSKESGTSKELCAWIYLMEILEETEQFVYYRENNIMVGFAGYSKRHFLRKKASGFVRNRLYKSKQIKDLNALKEYEDNYYYVPEELENYFDGELSILILDKKWRGKGIGKKLLQEVFELAKKDHIKCLQIMTDESYNFDIYERLGCKKVYETVLENKEYGKLDSILREKAFIFENKL